MPRQFGKVDASARWPSCLLCSRMHESGSPCPPVNMWLIRGLPSRQPGVVWLKRPMPDGQWPPGDGPRDDSFSWWVRSTCGHEGGAKQWAFHEEADADMYEQIFRADPCRWTRCPERTMIENGRGR